MVVHTVISALRRQRKDLRFEDSQVTEQDPGKGRRGRTEEGVGGCWGNNGI